MAMPTLRLKDRPAHHLWLTEDYYNKVYRITTNGTVDKSFGTPHTDSTGLAWDGAYLWNADDDNAKVYKLTTNGTVLKSFDAPRWYPLGLTWV